MSLTPDQENEVRVRIIAQFGEENVMQMDKYFMELYDLQFGCADSYIFLEKVREKYTATDPNLLCAAILFGMKRGEVAYECHIQQMEQERKQIPGYE